MRGIKSIAVGNKLEIGRKLAWASEPGILPLWGEKRKAIGRVDHTREKS